MTASPSPLPDPDFPSESDSASRAVREVRYEHTPNLPEILAHAGVSLLVTTYQAGKLLVLGSHAGRLTIAFANFEQAMGLSVADHAIAIGGRQQIHFYVPAHGISASLEPQGTFDACFVPRCSHYTGNIHGHDLAWGQEGLWVVNTLFSSLCTLNEGYNFIPRWRPPFISRLIDQDRCHLNGLAIEDGSPRYVTVLGATDEPAGWRPNKAQGGCILDVPGGEIVARGFAMPHSPRIHQGHLWILDSGTGRIGIVDRARGSFEPVESVPGYTRGLCFAGQFAFVGLSKIRETAIFGGVPIAEKRGELRCGVAVIDLVTGKAVSAFQFHSGVEEIFAVEAIPGKRNPMFAGASVNASEREVWVVPPEDHPRPVPERRLPLFASGTGVGREGRTAQPHFSQMAAMAASLRKQGRLSEAAATQREAIAISPQPAPLWVELGNLCQEMGDQDQALECYRQAVESDPHCEAARQNLGYLLFNRGLPEEAVSQYEALLRINDKPLNRLLAAGVVPIIYASQDDLRVWRTRMETRIAEMVGDGQRVDAKSQLVPTEFFLPYQGRDDRQVMSNIGKILQGEISVPPRSPLSPRTTRRPLRVGFVSAYFRDHTIGRLNLGRIQQLDRSKFHVSVAFASRGEDPMAAAFRDAADSIVQLTRDVPASRRQLTDLKLDVLVFADVGMDALTTTLAYSRMAPVQCVTWGHPETTGSPCMDYFLSSELLEDAAAQANYTETLLRPRLLGTYYERPRRTGPPRTREFFGISPDRHLYLCPQTLFKFHPEFDAVLAGILARDPLAEIQIIEGRVANWTERLRKRWNAGIPGSAERIRFLPAQPRDDFLALLELADVMIDPMHFGGGNTTYEAFGMGTPVTTLPSEFLRGRITLALYRKMGVTFPVARTPEELIEKSVAIATDPKMQSQLRAEIQSRAAVLFEDPEEVHVLEEVLTEIS